ncbi:uncharacterized protein [Spinacia oleracea]|uniref:CCHC-type domain-containing protein n=1 Tax=Spinacia oleracea TaxID=3562 RepID=A0ABM3R3V1_SPIOL|nr:uncharacterized protein LOC130465516 [Spinacia oleracea]
MERAGRSYSHIARGYQSDGASNLGLDQSSEDIESDDDTPSELEVDDGRCPVILLSKDEKKRLRAPWRNSLIIKLFDKRLSYAVLMRRLKLMWSLKGEIALTDVGCAYYVVRFTSREDYNFVMTQGPWMIGESYLTIRKWIPNFVPDEEPIKFLTAWIRIPNLFVEYFDRGFLYRIGEKIGRVVRIDKNTESMDRGQYVRFCIEVDLSKPLLSKFRLNGRVWRIQYEGLRQICFKCGHLGHKDAECPKFEASLTTTDVGVGGELVERPREAEKKAQKPEEHDSYGAWMLVQRAPRRTNTRTRSIQGRNTDQRESGSKAATSKVQQQPNQLTRPQAVGKEPLKDLNLEGSRFAVLGEECREPEKELNLVAQEEVKRSSDNRERNQPIEIPSRQKSQPEEVDLQGENSSLEGNIIKERQNC